MKTTTKWNDDYLSAPCIYLGQRCEHHQAGEPKTCRESCESFQKYRELRSKYNKDIEEMRKRNPDYRGRTFK